MIGPLANLLLLGYGPKPVLQSVLTDVPGIKKAFIGGSWAAHYQGQAGAFPHDVDVIVVGTPTVTTSPKQPRGDHAVGHDGQVGSAARQLGETRKTHSP